MPAPKKDPSKVKSKSITVRISPDEQKALQEWSQKAKLGPTMNERSNISELIRQTILRAITTK